MGCWGPRVLGIWTPSELGLMSLIPYKNGILSGEFRPLWLSIESWLVNEGVLISWQIKIPTAKDQGQLEIQVDCFHGNLRGPPNG